MSEPYYRFFPGDYARDTRHLSMCQHGAYRLLIDLYMDTGGPLRNDLPYLHRFLRAESIEEKAAIEFILAEFFMLSTTGKNIGWKNKRCDEELAWRLGKITKATESAKKRWVCERTAKAMRTQYDGNANQNQINTKTARIGASPNPNRPWHQTPEGIAAKAQGLGLKSNPGESHDQLRSRIFQHLKENALA